MQIDSHLGALVSGTRLGEARVLLADQGGVRRAAPRKNAARARRVDRAAGGRRAQAAARVPRMASGRRAGQRARWTFPIPAHSPVVVPNAVLLPMNGWDQAGYRLGYGGGFFDRTLASVAKKAGRHRRDLRDGEDGDHPPAKLGHSGGLGGHRARRVPEGRRQARFLGEPPAGEPSSLASPVCYADEIAPGYFGERTRGAIMCRHRQPERPP